MEDNRLNETEAQDVEEEEEAFDIIPMTLDGGSTEDDEFEDDEDYEDEYDDYYEDEEVEELIPSETRVSNSIPNGFVDDSNVCDGKPVSQQNGEVDVCPICFEAWTGAGDHRICCLPCGHVYGMSCIKKWLLRCQGSGKCPQCKSICTLKDIIVLYTTRLCAPDELLHKRRIQEMRSLVMWNETMEDGSFDEVECLRRVLGTQRGFQPGVGMTVRPTTPDMGSSSLSTQGTQMNQDYEERVTQLITQQVQLQMNQGFEERVTQIVQSQMQQFVDQMRIMNPGFNFLTIPFNPPTSTNDNEDE